MSGADAHARAHTQIREISFARTTTITDWIMASSNVPLFSLILLLSGLEATCAFSHRRPSVLGRMSLAANPPFRSPPSYETKYYEQRLDHFNVGDERTFQQRYLYNGDAWNGKGPLFVYTGNEGDIAWFYNNTV